VVIVDTKEIEAFVNIGMLIGKVGWPMALKIIESIKMESVTLDQIKALRKRLPIDEPFFSEEL